MEQGFIDALKGIRYLFFKGNEVAELRLELRIAEKILFDETGGFESGLKK